MPKSLILMRSPDVLQFAAYQRKKNPYEVPAIELRPITSCDFEDSTMSHSSYSHHALFWNVLSSESRKRLTQKNQRRSLPGKALNHDKMQISCFIQGLRIWFLPVFLCSVYSPFIFISISFNSISLQAETYRRMRKATSGDWQSHHPSTNTLWMHYLADLVMSQKQVPATTDEKRQLRNFR